MWLELGLSMDGVVFQACFAGCASPKERVASGLANRSRLPQDREGRQGPVCGTGRASYRSTAGGLHVDMQVDMEMLHFPLSNESRRAASLRNPH